MEKFAFGREKNMMSSLFGSEDDSSSDEEGGTVPALIDENGSILFTSQTSGTAIQLLEHKALGIAHQLWPAAKFMCNYLDEHSHLLSEHVGGSINILELGAGVGLCGLFAAAALRHHSDIKVTVVLTDLPEALGGLNENISLNGLNASVSSAELSWGVDGQMERVFAMFDAPPLVIAADCVYYQCLFRPLFLTIKGLTDRGCVVIIAHVKRWKKDAKFFGMCRKHGMTVQLLHEIIEIIPAEHTGIPTSQTSQINRFSSTVPRRMCA